MHRHWSCPYEVGSIVKHNEEEYMLSALLAERERQGQTHPRRHHRRGKNSAAD